MNREEIHLKIKSFEKVSEPLLTQFAEVSGKIEKSDLSVKAFYEIIRDCKEEVISSTDEHKKHILKLLYDLEIDDTGLKDSTKNLNDYLSSRVNSPIIEEYEKVIDKINLIVSDIDQTIEELNVDYNEIFEKNKKWYVFQGEKLKFYEVMIERLTILKEKLNFQIVSYSKVIADSFIDNFYNVYIFFSFLINLTLKQEKNMLLAPILNILDKNMDIIKSSLENEFLYFDDLIYHYIIFEFKDLSFQILKR